MLNKLKDKRVILLVLMLAILALNVTAVFAQEEAVSITVPTDEIFTQTNTWIEVFAPIVAIGAGIAIALAVLKFIVSQIISAFRTGW